MHTMKRGVNDLWDIVFVSPNGDGPAHERIIARCATPGNAAHCVSWLNGGSQECSLSAVRWIGD